MKKLFPLIETSVAIGLLLFAVKFNLDLYHLEPTALTDPNDNTFQFGLVDRTNQIFDFADKSCPKNIFSTFTCKLPLLVDHWVPNWAQGYNLPFYYSHVPQILIVGSYRFIQPLSCQLSAVSCQRTLFQYYHWVIYLLLCFFPVAMFWALRVIRLPWIIAGVGAILATHISTDGLYGLDPPSFLWRGYGLSSQLFAMLPFPLALAYSWRYFVSARVSGLARTIGAEIYEQLVQTFPSWQSLQGTPLQKQRDAFSPRTRVGMKEKFHSTEANATPGNVSPTFWLAVLFTALTVMGHLGIGFMAMMSAGLLAIVEPIIALLREQSIKDILAISKTKFIQLALLAGITLFFVSYWLIPTVTSNNYHNISMWDPIWKFNSYGWKEILIRFFDGNLFDFGRFPWFTLLVIAGGLLALPTKHAHFSFLTAFWLILYFGRTTWKGLIDVIPGMSEFHISRFIVGLHAGGLFLAPMAIHRMAEEATAIILQIANRVKPAIKQRTSGTMNLLLYYFIVTVLLFMIVPSVYKQTIYYNELNDKLIIQGNDNATKDWQESEALIGELKKLPSARVFAGRGGGWGKDWRIAETPIYMHLSTYGIPTVLWLPQTWSPNSDIEQYFSEDIAKDYDLFNIRYIAAPIKQAKQPFWKEIKRSNSWVIYEAPTTGYFTVGTRSQVIVSEKTNLINVTRLWIQSAIPTQKLYPQISFVRPRAATIGNLPVIEMLDEVTYKTASGQTLNIFANNPLYSGDAPALSLVGPESVEGEMIYGTKVTVQKDCRECLVVLKQTYHPNWKATVDGKPIEPIIVFPFYIGIPLASEGSHEIRAWYEPSAFKVLMLNLSIFIGLAISTRIAYAYVRALLTGNNE